MNSFDTAYSCDIFVDKPHSRLLCSMCTMVMNNPHQCFNGHLFCYVCLRRRLKLNSTCPICNVDLSPEVVPNKAVGEMISELNVKCTTSACLWIGPLSSRANHIDKQCMFSTVECTMTGCTAMARFCLSDHQQECVYRLVSCDQCEQFYPLTAMHQHKSNCVERPVMCPNSCESSLRFSQLQLHLEDECPLQEVLCAHYMQGCCAPSCNGTYLRMNTKQHEWTRRSACCNVDVICRRVIASDCVGEVDDRVRWIMDNEKSIYSTVVQGEEYTSVRL